MYGEFRQIVPDHFGDGPARSITAEGLPHVLSGTDWISHSLFFFAPHDEFFVARLSNKGILVFESRLGRLVDDRWKEASQLLPDRIKKYEELREDLGRLIVLKALQLASSDQSTQRDDGLFVLNQCRDRNSIRILEQAVRDPTGRIINTPQGRLREYPVRKAAIKALTSMGEKVPEGVVTEEKAEE